jgi:uncharacterized SAM-dependent methyltransferase
VSALAQITVHASQFPENVRRDLRASLRERRVNHKFLYDSYRQTQKWLALHQAFSPARTDPDCAATYDRAFESLAPRVKGPAVHLLGLGCGGGQKDARLLRLLRNPATQLFYTPVDVSVAMVLVARGAALSVIPAEHCFGLVCDLASAELTNEAFDPPLRAWAEKAAGLAAEGDPPASSGGRIITFFGMMPNFEPPVILPRLAGLLRPGDALLLSANLAPGNDYAAGMRRILPQYDNAPTRDWLVTFLLDLGVEADDGELRFRLEEVPAGGGLRRVAAYFEFRRARQIRVDDEGFDFQPGDTIRLFFSYRHTPALLAALLREHGLAVLDQWVTGSQEEGIFLCQRVS